MEALAERLSHLDSHAHGAIRVVTFYDTLMRRRLDLPALARASAGLAGCVVGIGLHGTGRVVRRTPEGTTATGPPGAAPSTTAVVVLDEEEIGTVWLERAGPSNALDEVLLDRLALAVASAVERYGPARTTMADPALVELAVGPDTEDAARARALRLLGFGDTAPVRAVAVRAPLPLDRVGALLCPGGPVKAASVGGVGVLLASAVDVRGLPADARAGVGAAGSPEVSWRQARTALRFATGRRPAVHYADLGALALLAEVPPDVARAHPDVVALARVAGSPHDLDTLDAYCATGSLRRAADLLHLHHSSVARRLEQIGTALGFDLTCPTGLVRASVALTLWRVGEE
ncbi:helix-turn-helix domain-containing protein [Streptomyces sp. JNUCC 64]